MTPVWLKRLPKFLQDRIEYRPNLQKALTNTGWLFGDKILRMGVGLLVGVWVARYLGPEQFGLMNYAMAIVALFGAVASLGLNGVVVRDLVQDPDSAKTTLGTAFLLEFIGGFLAFGLAIVTIGFARPGDSLAKLMVAVLGFVMVFKSTEVVKHWFESQVESKYVVWMESGVFLLLALVKIGLILAEAPLMAFVWAAFVEGALVAVGLLGVFAWRGGAMHAWRVRFSRAKSLLNEGWPLILSGLAVMVYMRIDQIMLGQMLGDEVVGIYSAAVRISEIWYFIPVVIAASVFPSIIEAKKQSEALYYQRLQKLYDLMVLVAFAVAIPMTFLSHGLVDLLFGVDFAGAGAVLAIHVWAGVFTCLGVASGNWFLLENMSTRMFYRTALGALINIALNLILIPSHGAQGAAIATLVSYSVAGYWFDALDKKTRRTFFMKSNSIFFKYLYVRQENH